MTLKHLSILAGIIALSMTQSVTAQEDFLVEVHRETIKHFEQRLPDKSIKVGKGIVGTIIVNGADIGKTVENYDLRIPPGVYQGYMRYFSGKNFVQTDFGLLGKTGDFLLEIAHVPKRTDILFHGGTMPWHSRGCILLGAVQPATDRLSYANDENHPLRKLRRLFYGTDTPNSSPNKRITITVRDP